jgi:hypothetical protein
MLFEECSLHKESTLHRFNSTLENTKRAVPIVLGNPAIIPFVALLKNFPVGILNYDGLILIMLHHPGKSLDIREHDSGKFAFLFHFNAFVRGDRVWFKGVG